MHNHSNTNVTDFPQHIMKQVHCHTSPCTTHGLWQMKEKHTVNQCSNTLLTAKLYEIPTLCFHAIKKNLNNSENSPSMSKQFN